MNFTSTHKFLLSALQQPGTAIYTKVIAVALLCGATVHISNIFGLTGTPWLATPLLWRSLDFSSEMIEIAKGKAEAQDIDHVTFEQLTIEELAVENCTYDAVLALSILHLLKDKERAIAKGSKMLKPSGIFVTSTLCLGDTMKWFKIIAPMGRFFGLMPLVKVFTTKELSDILTDTGFAIDYHWQPSHSQGVFKGVFIVAKKSK